MVITWIGSGLLVAFLIINGVSQVDNPEQSHYPSDSHDTQKTLSNESPVSSALARSVLETLPVKGRAPKTDYSRAQFGDGWDTVNGCTTRNIILHRDLKNPVVDDKCRVISGVLYDPYSDAVVYVTKQETSVVQIDHVVALSDAWQKGAQQLTYDERRTLANDPLELLAVSASQNQAKGDGDAATWLPKNKTFRCQYIARQIAVKKQYKLWVTQAEKSAMETVLASCPNERLP